MQLFPRTKSHIRQGPSVNINVSKVGVYPQKNQEKLVLSIFWNVIWIKNEIQLFKRFCSNVAQSSNSD